MRKCKPKSICSGRKKRKDEWIGHKVLNLKTGKSEWKMKKNQETKDYREPLKGEHLHTPRRQWKKGFERLAHDFAKGKKQRRKGERKERNEMKNE